MSKIAKVLLVLLLFLSPWAVQSMAFAQSGSSSDSGLSTRFLDVTYLLLQVKKQIPQLIKFIVALSYISGIFLFVAGVLKLKTYGQQAASAGNSGLSGALLYVSVGVALVFFPTMVNVSTASFMGSGAGDSIYAYSALSAGMAYSDVYDSVVAIIKLAGFIIFLKGWLILLNIGSNHGQGGVLTKGLIHVIGGIFAVNILTTWKILRAMITYVF